MCICVLYSHLLYTVSLHIQEQLSVHECCKMDILCRSEMRDPLPQVVYNPPCLFILFGGLPPTLLPSSNHCLGCHLLHFVCLLYSSLSAPNTSLCVSPFFYLQIPQCHHKKVRQRSISHLWIPVHFQMGGMLVCCFVCLCALSVFANEMKNISWCC